MTFQKRRGSPATKFFSRQSAHNIYSMAKNLVIVESPAKAKTIEGFLGKDFTVLSSYGHVRDLTKGDKAIDIDHGFTPTYQITPDKKDVVSALKKEVKKSDIVWLATDDDREGEAISWHLNEALGLDKKETKRIVFREITKTAILNSIQQPRTIDIDLVNAQQARRILDRLVGFELSPILWRKVKAGLSAGRVQSVAVRIVVDREREVEAFKAEPYFKVTALFDLGNGKSLSAELPTKLKSKEEANAFLQSCADKGFQIEKLEKRPGKKNPAPPFTTSTLQQEASRKLGFSVSQTMTLAQRLYESGKITYMRTDSLNLSQEAIGKAVSAITANYGKEYVETRTFKTKSASAQEAHEAIRPTDFSKTSASTDSKEQKLYELIWKRAIASQMAPAKTERTTATIGIEGNEQKLKATGEVITFEGFLKAYGIFQDEEEDGKKVLPPLNEGQVLELDNLTATERFTRPPARFTEATLVRQLEEMGIGRPSTYAPTISTIQKRGYVEKEVREGKKREYSELVLSKGTIAENIKSETTGADKGKLFPTDMAMIVNDFLVKNFPTVTDFSFTANIEKEFDEIAQGKVVWNQMIGEFYGGFHARVESTKDIDRSEVGGDRILGKHPENGKTILVRLGRFGPMAQIGTAEELPEDEKPQFAGLRKGQRLESITLEEALELFKLPRDVGMFEDKKIVAAIGRFGPYIRHDSKFVSLKEDDPLEVDEERAIQLILEKREADAKKFIKGFDENPDIQILQGRWGPYIKAGKQNVKIPKDIEDPTTLTLEDCLKLAEEQEKTGKGKKKPAAKKTTAKKTTTRKTTTKKKTTAKK